MVCESLCCPNIYTAIALLAILVVYKAVFWFIEPYSRYKNQSGDRRFSFYINGEKQATSASTLPLLLRPTKTKAEPNDYGHIQTSELCDLTLVVPCYNEDQRLPSMMESHLAYIKQKQASGVLPPRIEFVLVDDGSRDKTFDIILEMTKLYPEVTGSSAPQIIIRAIS